VKPAGAVALVVGMVSGYSIGYRMATWSSFTQQSGRSGAYAEHFRHRARHRAGGLAAGSARAVVMGYESDAVRFASVRGTQRIYTNFFRMALDDSNAFIPHEVARLDSAGSSVSRARCRGSLRL